MRRPMSGLEEQSMILLPGDERTEIGSREVGKSKALSYR